MATLSVAMCTFNGERYVSAQLESLLRQTRLPDELIVCDDASSDGTFEIANEFERKAPFFVRIVRNAATLGIRRNFENAIRLCRGDVIALSDQDDVWLPHKLDRQMSILAEHSEAGYTFSDAVVTDEELRSVGYTAWQAMGFGAREQARLSAGRQLAVLARRNVVMGATLAFRSELRPAILPFPAGWMHDAWIAYSACAGDRVGIALSEPLIKYRTHSEQSIGVGPARMAVSSITGLGAERGAWGEALLRGARVLEESSARLLGENAVALRARRLLEGKARHLRTRAKVSSEGRLVAFRTIAGEALAGNYWRFSLGLKSVAADVIRTVKRSP